MATETQNICRACLTEQGSFQSVFQAESNSGISLHISEMLNACANIQVTVGDGLPDQICILCAEVTVEMYLFKLRCEKSDKILRTRSEKLALRNEVNFLIGSEAETVKQPVKSENIVNLQNEAFIEDIKEFDSCDENKSDSIEEIKTTENNEEIAKSYEDLTLNKFECDICQKQFNQENLLMIHKIDHALKADEVEIKYEDIQFNQNSINQPATKSEEESIFSCPECEFFFDQKEYLDSHINSWHKKDPEAPSNNDTEKKPIKTKSDSSNLIEKGFHKSYNLKKHKGEKPYECNVCKKKLSSLQALTNHKRLHKKGNPYKCHICKIAMPTLRDLTAHTRNHRKAQTGEKLFECDICKKKFSQFGTIKLHKRIHTGERPFECDICDMKFSYSGVLKDHKKTHTGEKPYECEICKKKFARLENKKIHKKVHTGEKPHECDICKKGFSKSGHLKVHKRTHTGEKPYECVICKKKFSHSRTLKLHKVIHTGEKPFKCDVCKKAYSILGDLRDHKRIHTGEKPYECDICKMRFIKLGYLKKHKRIHTGEKPHDCDICNKKFTRLGGLKEHKKIHTGEKPHQCDICKKKFSTSTYLKVHKNLHKGM